MPKSARDVPPPLELLCLKALWGLQQGKVRDVQEIVAQSRPLAYTTIMTVLDRLVRKGKLTRQKTGRAFLYSPQTPRDVMRRAAIRELVEGYFDGSEEQLIDFLREGQQSSAAVAGAGTASPVDDGARIDTVLL
ncbi:MAG TPA: BlaI/MecI/CopY family transcriptional regulator [Candidatus Sulfopaludibacter sp.]|jgi:predicted transcriptional regulator|nr:BlaI/MecI/CopY family transcriptional regulator [Candidatus Sulfopaludibacter sp.]